MIGKAGDQGLVEHEPALAGSVPPGLHEGGDLLVGGEDKEFPVAAGDAD